jgi:hypothetical protein
MSDVMRYGVGTVDGHAAFGVTWMNVGYYQIHADKLNSFQLVLIERADTGAGNFDVEFNYNQILWEAGDASYASNGYGGAAAREGISDGLNHTIETAYSGVTLAQLDANPNTGLPNYTTGLIYRSRNSTVPGRYVYPVRGGLPVGALNVNAGPDQTVGPTVTSRPLAGSASDPGGGAVSVHWSVLATGNTVGVTFSNPNILNPTVTFPAIPAGSDGKVELVLTATSVANPTITAADLVRILAQQ